MHKILPRFMVAKLTDDKFEGLRRYAGKHSATVCACCLTYVVQRRSVITRDGRSKRASCLFPCMSPETSWRQNSSCAPYNPPSHYLLIASRDVYNLLQNQSPRRLGEHGSSPPTAMELFPRTLHAANTPISSGGPDLRRERQQDSSD